MEERKIRVAITQGDINGVGYEVILKTFQSPELLELCTPIVYGSPKVLAYHRKAIESPTNYCQIETASAARDGQLNIVNCNGEEVHVELGHSTAEAGTAAYEALEAAVRDYRDGLVDVLVTAPINKKNIQNENFAFHGHTEYLAERLGEGEQPLMILLRGDLRVALVTGHIPVSQIAATLTQELVMEKIDLFNMSLKRDFCIDAPRIAVLALNPHAGDDGLLGQEEQTVIEPAIRSMAARGVLCYGPFAADGFLGSGAWQRFDGVLAMYHDQGLAPFKVLAMDEGVNFTAGLPVVRTSPDHGTAYDIAGRGEASEASFRQAIYTAIDVWRRRKFYDQARVRPLRKQYFEKRDDSDKLNLQAEEEN